MKYSPLNLLLTFLFLAGAVFSQGKYTEVKDPAAFKKKFSEVTRKTQTIESDFIQEKNLSVLSDKITMKGRFMFKKENKLRWEYTNPYHYLIILNNGTMYTQDEDKKQKIDVGNNKMFTEINSIIMGCVEGNLFNDEKKFVTSFLENQESYLVTLKPRASSLKYYLSEIRICFDKKDLMVTRLEMHEPSGDYTKIDFSGKKINTFLPDEKFLLP
ncbi:MAG: outer membrane lipoprotein carrier protein LolA [Bacteroidetes bacterium]|nr:outer membrane lipoprotein carrier protein LolA [Bacteroidota bacterium]